MRHAPLPCILLLLLASTTSFAQVGRDIRFVNTNEAEVYSGPGSSKSFYVTNRLQKGTPVEVTQDLPGGWLKIRPPEGSFSYIDTRFLRHIDPDLPNHVVTLDGVKVPVYIGSDVVNKRPTVVGTWLERGAQVVRRGRPMRDSEGAWMPIDPPEQERRYIRADAVTKTTPPERGSTTVAGTAIPDNRNSNSLVSRTGGTPSANYPSPAEVLLNQANTADHAGRISEAVALYARFAAENGRSHPELSAKALKRAEYLQGAYQNYGASVGLIQPRPGADNSSVAATSRITPGTSTTSPLTTTTTIKRDSSAFIPAQQNPANNRSPYTWVRQRGRLVKSGRIIGSRNLYRLEDPDGLRPIGYITPHQGVDLERFVDKVVIVDGWSIYRGDLRSNYTTVHFVYPGQ